ncbi:hypothetical protein L249_6252 [Ophiocordyceps polyrhachis-furcata BCC 54312]|uniref:Uncharacterized protein n=1 Tax=Ophiocordyceps polyrhachis-furcata BCC 54312 TaxID=1330021 RepID=A0A367L107_9HYPO|nr:hypothetical protein L249_6252 [Ophiocordyceps polyrhachis-furcata BCC 54312]
MIQARHFPGAEERCTGAEKEEQEKEQEQEKKEQNREQQQEPTAPSLSLNPPPRLSSLSEPVQTHTRIHHIRLDSDHPPAATAPPLQAAAFPRRSDLWGLCSYRYGTSCWAGLLSVGSSLQRPLALPFGSQWPKAASSTDTTKPEKRITARPGQSKLLRLHPLSPARLPSSFPLSAGHLRKMCLLSSLKDFCCNLKYFLLVPVDMAFSLLSRRERRPSSSDGSRRYLLQQSVDPSEVEAMDQTWSLATPHRCTFLTSPLQGPTEGKTRKRREEGAWSLDEALGCGCGRLLDKRFQSSRI